MEQAGTDWKEKAQHAEAYGRGKRALAQKLLGGLTDKYMDAIIADRDTVPTREVLRDLEGVYNRLVMTNETAQPRRWKKEGQ